MSQWVDDTHIDISSILLAEGNTYTVPQNGFLHLELYASTDDSAWRITSSNGLRYWIHENKKAALVSADFPIHKGEVLTVTLTYNLLSNAKAYFRPI